MAVEIAAPHRMNAVTGLRAFAVAAVAEVSGATASPDHAIAIAVIAAVGTIVTVLLQATIADWLRARRKPEPVEKHPDHDEEQSVLNDLLLGQMVHLQRENEDLRSDNDGLRSELARLRKRRA